MAGRAAAAGMAGGGTTGYDFLNAVNGVFIDPDGLARLEEIYSRRTGNYLPFAERCYQCNKLAINTMFHGDMASLDASSEARWRRSIGWRATSVFGVERGAGGGDGLPAGLPHLYA